MKKLKLDIQRFSSTNKTANYELPQFVGTDKPTWLGDINEAMSDIDAGMHANATAITSMASDVATASATASQASQDVAGLTSTVSTLSSNVTAVTTTANNAQSTATSALNTANTANGKSDTNASDIVTLNTKYDALDTKYDALEENVLGLDGAILWENQSPSSGFTSQNITLSSSDYDLLEIYTKQAKGNLRAQSTRIPKGYDGMLYTEYDDGTIARRLATRVSDTQYTIGSVQSTAGYNDDNVIPIYVVGYKINIFNGN